MAQIILIASIVFASVTLARSQTVCGKRNSTYWPWHVSIQRVEQDPDVPACGGTILNDLFVITAGHCVYDLGGNKITPSQLVVTIDRPSAKRLIHVKRVAFPYYFDVNKFDNDVVLVKLDQPIVFSDEVGPICFPEEESEIFPAGSVTIPILKHESKSIQTVEWRITDYSLCHGTNYYIFNSSYNHSICMGYIRDTDKFQFYRGSGLMMQRHNSWYLVGILLYTSGPTSIAPTYGGGLVLAAYAKAIMTIANKHLVKTIIDEKCEYYNTIAKEQPESYFYPYISIHRNNDDFIMPKCIGTLISEKFVLTAAICTQSVEMVVLWKSILGTTLYRKFRFHFHPKDTYRQGIALVELDENVSHMEYFINCIWTNEEDSLAFGSELKHGSQLLKLGARVQYRPGEAVSYRLEDCNHFTVFLSCKPGDVLATKKAGDKVNRIVGLITENVEDCHWKTALNVVSYLDWIEEIVWKNATNVT